MPSGGQPERNDTSSKRYASNSLLEDKDFLKITVRSVVSITEKFFWYKTYTRRKTLVGTGWKLLRVQDETRKALSRRI